MAEETRRNGHAADEPVWDDSPASNGQGRGDDHHDVGGQHDADDTDDETGAKPKSGSQSTRLVNLALETYRLGVSPDGKPFGYRPSESHIALPLRGGKLGLRQALAREYFKEHRAAPSQSALTDCLTVLEGMAREQPPTPLHLRVAADETVVHIDMADENNRVIEIGGGRWKIIDDSRFMFSRTELTAPMADPKRGGDLDKLWQYVNVAKEDQPVLLAVMVDALIQPTTPKPVTGFLAEHGCAKSSTTKCVVSLIDPSVVPARAIPRDLSQWMTTAAGSYVVAVDNLSTIPDWLSDAICRAATGDGDVRRQLYTDDSLLVVKMIRSVIINGIDPGGLNGDFTDRLAPMELKQIATADRREEKELHARWDMDRAEILGGVLDLAAMVHARLSTLGRIPLPRMADFGRVLTCVDQVQGNNGMKRYYERTAHMMADSAMSDSFIARLVDMRYATKDDGGEPASDILILVTPNGEDKGWKRPLDWPKTARQVTQRLRKHGPAMRSMGWTVSNDEGHNKFNTARWLIRPPTR